MEYAKLSRYGLLGVKGEDARAFLHAQLTNDIAGLPPGRAALAGWCSAKGRLLATFLVVPVTDGFLLQLSADLVPTVAKRLSMFVLRAKVKVTDESSAWQQLGVWGELPGLPAAQDPFSVSSTETVHAICMESGRLLVLARDPRVILEAGSEVPEDRWRLEEIRANRPIITSATQDLFVPQMVNYEKIGGVSFQKGCYPGQEVVARAQYRGQVKRRMRRVASAIAPLPRPGDEFQGGTVVDAASAPGGEAEMLVVLPLEGE